MDARFGPFRILSRLGRGGMAETFVAERTGPAGFAQRVCLKRILPQGAVDEAWIRSFQTEARVVALLQHPNVASLLDFGEHDGRWWMSLELVEGADLRTVLAGARTAGTTLPVDVVVAVAIELAKALRHAHARALPNGAPAGIVHRDVTPGNVLLSYDGAVKLTDFGIAKIAGSDRTRTGIVKGKSAYMAPEQLTGAPLDHRADLFALGVVLFEMTAGQRPFDGKTDLGVQKSIVDGARRDLRELAPHVPPALVAVIDQLLATDRDRRMRSADDLLDALSDLTPRSNVVRALGALVSQHAPHVAIPDDGALTEIDVKALSAR